MSCPASFAVLACTVNRLTKKFALAAAAALIMSLVACNNYDLLDQLESPGKNTNNSLYLFSTDSSINGDIKGAFSSAREGADATCLGTRAAITFPNNGCSQVRAVISLTPSDSILNMPTNYGIPTNFSIYAQNNFTIAPDWNVLISGGGTALAPNVMPEDAFWWSFSITGGSHDLTDNCSNGTSSAFSGAVGFSSTSGPTWLRDTNILTCESIVRLLCICY